MVNHPVTGGCLCGGVQYQVAGRLRDIIACHCKQCRRTSGHFVAATACRKINFTLTKARSLAWFSAIAGFRRGFCSVCGSSLFFEETNGERMSIAAGSLDQPQGLRMVSQLFVSEAADYYQIDPDIPCSNRGEHSVPLP